MQNQRFQRNNHTNEGKIARIRIALASSVLMEYISLEIKNTTLLHEQPWILELSHEDALFEGFSFSEATDEQGVLEDFSFSLKILKSLSSGKFGVLWKSIKRKNLIIEFLNFNENKRMFGPLQANYSLKQPDNFFEGEYYQINFKPARVYDNAVVGEIIDSAVVECINP